MLEDRRGASDILLTEWIDGIISIGIMAVAADDTTTNVEVQIETPPILEPVEDGRCS